VPQRVLRDCFTYLAQFDHEHDSIFNLTTPSFVQLPSPTTTTMNTLESPKRTSIRNLLNPQDTPAYQPSVITDPSHTASYTPQYHTNNFSQPATSWPSNPSYGVGSSSQSPRYEQRNMYGVTESSPTRMSAHPEPSSHYNHIYRDGDGGASWAQERRVQAEAYMVEPTGASNVDSYIAGHSCYSILIASHHIDVDTQGNPFPRWRC
jgi:hypothetical protein